MIYNIDILEYWYINIYLDNIFFIFYRVNINFFIVFCMKVFELEVIYGWEIILFKKLELRCK